MGRQIDTRTGAALIAELEEFSAFSVEIQHYIRRSLDVASRRPDPIERWGAQPGRGRGYPCPGRSLPPHRWQSGRMCPRRLATSMQPASMCRCCSCHASTCLAVFCPGSIAMNFLYERLLGAAISSLAGEQLRRRCGDAGHGPSPQHDAPGCRRARHPQQTTHREKPTFYPEWIGDEVIEISGLSRSFGRLARMRVVNLLMKSEAGLEQLVRDLGAGPS